MSNLSNDNSNKKRGLGRGLGSLLGGSSEAPQAKGVNASADIMAKKPTAPAATTPVAATAVPVETQKAALASATPQAPVDPESKIWKVAIDKLASGEYQPRTHFDKAALQELAQSIKENGILQPIVARRIASGKLEIVAGERRWRAAQLAGLHEVPVILKSYTDQKALELAIIENVQREDLNPIEEADGYQRLISEFSMSQQQVADKVGRDRATVANAVRLLQLPEEVKKMITESQLAVGHAKVLLSLTDKLDQVRLAKACIKEKMSVRKLEKEVQSIVKPKSSEPEGPGQINVTDRLMVGLSEELQKILGTKVSIDYAKAKGKISIHFYSDDELSSVVEKIRNGWQA